MRFKYLDENYSPSQILWGMQTELTTTRNTLRELAHVDIPLEDNKMFHKTMMDLLQLQDDLSALRHTASREKIECLLNDPFKDYVPFPEVML